VTDLTFELRQTDIEKLYDIDNIASVTFIRDNLTTLSTVNVIIQTITHPYTRQSSLLMSASLTSTVILTFCDAQTPPIFPPDRRHLPHLFHTLGTFFVDSNASWF